MESRDSAELWYGCVGLECDDGDSAPERLELPCRKCRSVQSFRLVRGQGNIKQDRTMVPSTYAQRIDRVLDGWPIPACASVINAGGMPVSERWTILRVVDAGCSPCSSVANLTIGVTLLRGRSA